MNLFTWSENRIKKFKWYDIGLFKLYIFSVTLLIAKLWSPILSLDWYWYALVFVLTGIRIVYVMFSSSKTASNIQ